MENPEAPGASGEAGSSVPTVPTLLESREAEKMKHRAEVAERKQQRQLEVKQRRLNREMYERKIQEQRYKALMHLLDKSQFYSNYIMKNIDDNSSQVTDENSRKVGRRSKRSHENDQISPSKMRKTSSGNKKVLKEIVSNRLKEKQKRKANLSTEEIAESFALSSDEEEEQIETVKENKEFVHPDRFVGILHDFQKVGLDWLKVLNEKGLNGILADEMGLGKTIQVIALICHLIETNQPGPYLIVAPLSTLPNWIMEFERFAPEVPVVLFHGPQDERLAMYNDIKKMHKLGSCKTQPVVITSFEIPYREKKFLLRHSWRYIIVDEGHRIKNHECQLVQALKQMTSLNRLLLTGTPLHNNLSELWSLLNFLLPDLFDDLEVFESWFNAKELADEDGAAKLLKQEEEKNVMASLREILKPFMLRRVKDEVNLQIPPKKEIIVFAPISELQRDLYKAVLSRDIQRLIDASKENIPIINSDGKLPKRRCTFTQSYNEEELSKQSISNNLRVSSVPENAAVSNLGSSYVFNQQLLSEWKDFTTITNDNAEYLVRMKFGNRASTYKKIVNHPYLVYCPLEFSVKMKPDERIIKASGKLLLLDKLLEKLKAGGHKILLFSTMTTILDTIEDYLTLRKDYHYVRLDGQVRTIEERATAIKAFNNDPNMFLFLISTRAGGVGLNLAAADTVIIYDCDWNPQMDIQAMSRCHRIGQTKPVLIYKLCTRGTIDEQILKRGEAKRKLERMVISEDFSLHLNNKETLIKLKQLLESSANDMVSENVIDDEELNKILDRSDMLKC